MLLPERAVRRDASAQPFIVVASGAPYFADENSDSWTPIGQNDAITWPDLAGLYRRRDAESAESYIRLLAEQGITCLRLMMEYSQTRYRYFERRPGTFNPDMVRLWDDLFHLCRAYGMRLLLTPFDTFWMWNKWKHHPYNAGNGGPCSSRNRWMLCANTRKLIKDRFDFATERWGGDGTIFAWDLWNEIHPAHAENSAGPIFEFIEDLSTHLRKTEKRLHGVAHLQTVSVFTPAFVLDPRLENIVFRHPCLDFVNVHLYEEGTIDHPRNTVDAAVSTGRLIADAIVHTPGNRPVFDSEHGPIHTFKDHHRTLPESFDDEYFRHMQWAHLASGGAGGGMRWPNRNPHSLTAGMRKAQQGLSKFLPCIDWKRFRRKNMAESVKVSRNDTSVFACGDESQALVYLLRRDAIGRNGMIDRAASPLSVEVRLPGLKPGAYSITFFDTLTGIHIQNIDYAHFSPEFMTITTPTFTGDIAVAIRNHRA